MTTLKVFVGALLTFACASLPLAGQSTGTVTQTVNQRNTIGVLTAAPTPTVVAGSPVTFTYLLHTAGAPISSSATVQFFDGTTALGSAQPVESVAASNLLPYSEVDLTHGWVIGGTPATVSPKSATGADASANSATTVTFTDTTSSVVSSIPGSTTYAGKQMTFSFWAYALTPATLSLTIADSPQVAASSSNTCVLSSTPQRCVLTYEFPAAAGTGFAVSLSAPSSVGIPITTWGLDVEQASASGGFVSTIGTPRPSGGVAGSVSFEWSQFLTGQHTISVQYSGDSNFVGSTSNSVTVTVIKQTPSIVLSDSPTGTSVYGAAVTVSAVLADAQNSSGWIPTGVVQFYDGAALVGTGTLDSGGRTSITLVGSTSLAGGTHTLTAQYLGDAQFDIVTSGAITHSVTRADSSSVVTTAITSSLNPAVYGDSVTLSFSVSSSVGVQPTGSVSVVDGATQLGTVVLDGSGNGTLTIPLFTAGSHSITATYSGDGNYN